MEEVTAPPLLLPPESLIRMAMCGAPRDGLEWSRGAAVT